ncbi:uracil-DNA glycosylase [Streptococcus pluranimalium]|uniref:Uracil-DNA glycosylase n=1 Tax=Streptococcus pluranimalium TaxID=82348 RepID=A0A2L0D3N4_9STRE|nr:uracil-DNA glycosylase [Streptococcus pluranimalium]AUW96443.1 uracil-DNA glycosylase [Streptococcus pluranimalium]
MEHSKWHDLLKKQLPADYFSQINHFLDDVYRQGIIYPKRENIFKALSKTDYDQVKVLILGQDPYHGPGQAQGLSFSVPDDMPAPPSLQNILKELADDIGLRSHHDLTTWAEEGVLLLNACLTVPAGQANGHANLIWEPFTDAVISLLDQREEPLVFILWGAYARKKKTLIKNSKHLILEAPHPSPLSSYRGFFGSKPFSKTNQFLEKHHQHPINWLQ